MAPRPGVMCVDLSLHVDRPFPKRSGLRVEQLKAELDQLLASDDH